MSHIPVVGTLERRISFKIYLKILINNYVKLDDLACIPGRQYGPNFQEN
jgi:hypothetical protein